MIIDFHSHILPGIDDGSKDIEMSLQMLAVSARQGIDIMIATPHFYADSMSISGFLNNRDRAYALLRSYGMDNILPQVVLGAEVAFFPGISTANNMEYLCIAGTNLLLIEMPFTQWNMHNVEEVEQLISKGFTIILAHLERFIKFQKDKEPLEELLQLPVYVQINAESFLTWKGRRRILKQFKNGTAHLIGSDCHNLTTRPQNLLDARSVINRKLGRGCLRKIDALGEALLGIDDDGF